MSAESRFPGAEEQNSGFPVFKSDLVPAKSLFLIPYEDDTGPGSDLTFTPAEQDTIEAVARYMARAEYAPSLVLASRTKRARETIDILTSTLGREPAVFMERALHYGSVQDMMERLRCVSNFIPSVLLIAGRRVLEALALQLSRGYGPYAARAARHRMMSDFPGGAFVALSLAVESWGAVTPKSGLLEAYVRPRDLQPQDH
jgi:phosphohistidine phosphatase SixA